MLQGFIIHTGHGMIMSTLTNLDDYPFLKMRAYFLFDS